MEVMALQRDRSWRGGSVCPGDLGAVSLEDRVTVLYETHREEIYRFLVGHGMSPGEAQDATQDVFVDLYTALKKGTAVESPRAWLYTVAGRSAADYWRRVKGGFRVQLELEESPAALMPADEPTPEEQARRNQRLRRIAAGLGQLPKEQRMCIQLRMQGLRYREIGAILGAPTSTVADWLAAAITALREDGR